MSDDDTDGEPWHVAREDCYARNVQTVEAWRSDVDGEIVAVERGVTHGARFTVTRFAAAIWEASEPLEYHGTSDDRSEAVERAKDVLRAKVDGDD